MKERKAAAARRFKEKNPTWHRDYRRANKKKLNLAEAARRHGVSVDVYSAAMEKPCGICGGKSEHLDHDHASGEVRAALCAPCNWGLGHFKDSAGRLEAAVAYLHSHEPKVGGKVYRV